MNFLKQLFMPFQKISNRLSPVVIITQVALLLILCQVFHSAIVPAPTEIGSSLIQLLQSRELWDNLIASLGITVQAMIYSILCTMIVVYLSTLPFFRPLAQFISKLRYLTITGLVFLFIAFTNNMGTLKLSLLMFGIVPFFTTSFLSVVYSIPQQQIDKAFVNRMNAWETLWEVVVIGRLDQLFEVMRQNFAISWMMITTVEAYDMSDGGIGTLFIKSNRAHNLPNIFAMLVIVLSLGLLFDWLLSYCRRLLFKYI